MGEFKFEFKLFQWINNKFLKYIEQAATQGNKEKGTFLLYL